VIFDPQHGSVELGSD